MLSSILLPLILSGAAPSPDDPPRLVEQGTLYATDPAGGGECGWSADVSGDTAVVGCPVGGLTGGGSAVVFERVGAAWSQTAVLIPADPKVDMRFGESVAIDGDTILVGALHADSTLVSTGAAYVFARNGASWTPQAKLSALDARPGDAFGRAVALSGDRAVVTANRDDDLGLTDCGSAYVFDRSGASWFQSAKLTANDANNYDLFGTSTAVRGDTIVVGADFDSSPFANAGSVYVFVHGMSGWSQQAQLVPADSATNDHFGRSVDLDPGGDVLVAGAWLKMNPNGTTGAAYLFTRAGGVWSEEVQLRASDAAGHHRFGTSVALDGALAVVGADSDDEAGVNAGASYVYHRTVAGWTEVAKLLPADLGPGSFLGTASTVDGDTCVIGASGAQPPGALGGAAWAYLAVEVFLPYCLGDGSAGACPCANESAPGAGQGCGNSTGQGARVAGLGSTSVTADDLALSAEGLLPGQPALAFAGLAPISPGVPFGDGLRCAGTGVVRLGVRVPDAAGTAGWGPGLAGSQGWPAGASRYVQVWYRDPVGGSCGFGFNLSNGLEVRLVP
jgi:hypothetical protein